MSIFDAVGVLALGEVPLEGPFNKTDWKDFNARLRSSVSSDYINFTLRMATAKLPFNNYDWPQPRHFLRKWTPHSEAFNHPTPRTIGRPFRQTDWPLPLLVKPVGQFWTMRAQIRPNPFYQTDWPGSIPPQYPTTNRTWINATALFNTPSGNPFTQDDWPQPIRTRPTGQFISEGPQITPNPFYQTDWRNPIPPQYPTSNRTWINATAAINTPPAAPFSQDDWPQPIRVKPQGQTWTEGPQITPNPFSQDDRPNAKQVQWPISARTWINATVALLTAPARPNSQYDWPLPQRPGYPTLNRTWISSTIGLRNQVVTKPFNQFSWPLPFRPLHPIATRSYSFSRSIVPPPAALPPGAQMWMVTPRGPRRWPITTENYSLALIPIPVPPVPEPAMQPRPFIRDYWDVDAWGRFVPGAGMRRG